MKLRELKVGERVRVHDVNPCTGETFSYIGKVRAHFPGGAYEIMNRNEDAVVYLHRRQLVPLKKKDKQICDEQLVKELTTAAGVRYKPQKKTVKMWPPIGKDNQGALYLGQLIFPTLEEAKKHYPSVIRLATELPPILVEIDE